MPSCAALLLVLVLVQVSHSAGAELTTFEQNTELDVTEPTTTVAPVVNGTSSAQRIGRRWWAATRSRRKSRSSVSTPPSGHNVCHPHNFYYHSDSQVGHQASCPFDWVVNEDSNRLPPKLIEVVCRGCHGCGPHRQCVQLKTRIQVFYQDTQELLPLHLRAGCVCMPQDIGVAANVLTI